eukprot:gene7481-10195_t
MARINNIIKFVVVNVNILFSVLGMFIIGFALYLLCANWGKLDPGFFLGSGLCILLFGMLLIIVSCLGCQGVNNQTENFEAYHHAKYNDDKKKPSIFDRNIFRFTGRKIIGIYQVLIIGAFIGELYVLTLLFNALRGFKHISIAIEDGETPTYELFESFVADKFNNFFFGATSSCKATLYFWFWSWVNRHCPSTLSQTNCQGCFSYSVTSCEADLQTCFSLSGGDGFACPYTICRQGLLDYLIGRLRDNLESILRKTGTLPQQVHPTIDNY